jgi:hypothetical protein
MEMLESVTAVTLIRRRENEIPNGGCRRFPERWSGAIGGGLRSSGDAVLCAVPTRGADCRSTPLPAAEAT